MTAPNSHSRSAQRGWRVQRYVHWIFRRNATLLVALTLLGLSVMGFIEVAEDMLEGGWRGFDESVLLALRTPGTPDDPIGPPWLEEMVRDFTALGGLGVVTLITAAVCGSLLIARQPSTALYILVAVTGGALMSTLLKLGFDRPRPDLVAHGMHTYQSSFPSGHSMMSAVVYLTLGALLARLQGQRRQRYYVMGVAVLVVTLVGVSRIYLGVHWPTDVMAGWLAGAAWATSCWLGARALGRGRA
jgi:undecaprenyl-diphosphatase